MENYQSRPPGYTGPEAVLETQLELGLERCSATAYPLPVINDCGTSKPAAPLRLSRIDQLGTQSVIDIMHTQFVQFQPFHTKKKGNKPPKTCSPVLVWMSHNTFPSDSCCCWAYTFQSKMPFAADINWQKQLLLLVDAFFLVDCKITIWQLGLKENSFFFSGHLIITFVVVVPYTHHISRCIPSSRHLVIIIILCHMWVFFFFWESVKFLFLISWWSSYKDCVKTNRGIGTKDKGQGYNKQNKHAKKCRGSSLWPSGKWWSGRTLKLRVACAWAQHTIDK